MRASATSRTASPASYFASQAKADANKADDNSPFALLVASVAPKDATKPPLKDASNSAANAQGKAEDENSNPVPDTQTGNPPADAPLAPGALLASALQPGKPEKTAKDKDDVLPKTGEDMSGPIVGLAQLPQQIATTQPGPQTVPPAAQSPVQPSAAANADDAAGDIPIDAAMPAATSKPQIDAKPASLTGNSAQTGAPDLKTAPSLTSSAPTGGRPNTQAPTISQNKPAPQSPSNIENDDSAVGEDEDPVTPAANTADQTSVTAPTAGVSTADGAKIALAPQAPATQNIPAAGDGESGPPASDASKSRAAPNGVQHAAAHSAAARASLSNPGLENQAKDDPIKSGAAKSRVLPTQAGNTGKSDGGKSDASNGDASKAAATQPDVQNIPAAPKATPQPAPAAIADVTTIAAPQASASAVATATPAQHIQISAQASPDLPSLAVEIAAKSQSGAKQFDIRLDPPELGRVEVRLSIDATGKASAHLSADQPQTLSLLQKDAPILTRALRDAGLDVSDNGLNFSLRQQSENASGNGGNNNRRARSLPLSATLGIDAGAGSATYRAPVNGRLDIRV